MSKSKKPGTDLAALKARLAKKSKAAESSAPPPAVPPPGQVAAPHQPQVPPPGEVAAAPPLPAPGAAVHQPPPQAYVPEPQPAYQAPPEPQYHAPEPAYAAAPAADPDDPFGGGAAMSGFDPDAGLIDGGGDVAPRGSKGLVLFAALLAFGVGGVAGFLGNKIMGTRERVDAGKTKGAKMVEEVAAVESLRAGIAMEWDDVKKTVATDPKAGAEKVTDLLTKSFDKHPQVSALFGWQLASVHPSGIKRTFELYDEASRLKTDVGVLAGFLSTHVDALQAAGGPVNFGVVFKSDGAVMAELIAPLCGEVPDQDGDAEGDGPPAAPKIDKEALKPCNDPAKAVAYKARTGLGAESAVSVVLRGYGKGEMQPLLREGGMYNYALGLEPNKNALKVRDSLLKRVEDRLASMNKAQKIALKALANYADNPTVNGEGSQPDPGGDEGGEGGGEG